MAIEAMVDEFVGSRWRRCDSCGEMAWWDTYRVQSHTLNSFHTCGTSLVCHVTILYDE